MLSSCLYESDIKPATSTGSRTEVPRPAVYIDLVSTGPNTQTGTISTGDTIKFVLRGETAAGTKIRSVTATRQWIGFTGERIIPGFPKTSGFDSETSDTFSLTYVVNERVGTVKFLFAVADDSGNGKGSRTSYQAFNLRVLRNDSLRNINLVSQFDTARATRGRSFYNSFNEVVSNGPGAVANLTDITYGVIGGKPFLISPAARSTYGLETFQFATATKFARTSLNFNAAKAREFDNEPAPTNDTIWIKPGGTYLFANTTKNTRGMVEVVSIADEVVFPNGTFSSPGVRAVFNVKVQVDR